MPEPLFKGVITALITPFRDGQVDEAAFVKLVHRQIDAGVDGVGPVGTTGETATLSHDEHRRVVELCVETVAGRAAVVAGCGSNCTAEAVELARHAKRVGADAALVVSPYYNRPSQEGVYAHYAALNEAVQLPIIVYNVPSRTASDVSAETMARLAKLPNIVGVKDATGDLARASLMRKTCGEGFAMLSGDDPTALGYVAHGGHGCISVSSNVAPEAYVAFMRAALQGAFADALAWQDRLIGLHKALFADASPGPTKWALNRLGLCSSEVRLPLTACNAEAQQLVSAAMIEAGVA
jgi:4-hydroxy-tetrahydrodipicolinate synthase